MKLSAWLVACLLLVCGCSEDEDNPTVPPGMETFVISGQLVNQFARPCPDVKIIIMDSQTHSDSAITDTNGIYQFSGVHAGTIAFKFRPTTEAVAGLARYLDAETGVTVTRDTVCNFFMREFHSIFHDDCTNPAYWSMFGGVSHLDTLFWFADTPGESDSMVLSNLLMLPDDVGPAFVILQGSASPDDSGLIRLGFIKDGAYIGPTRDVVFKPISQAPLPYYIVPAGELSDPMVIAVRLDITHKTSSSYPADVVISDIWIACY